MFGLARPDPDRVVYESVFKYTEIGKPLSVLVPDAIDFRVISAVSSQGCLVLATCAYRQDIIMCTADSMNDRVLTSIGKHRTVLSASLSIKQDRLFIVLDAKAPGLCEPKCYLVQCILLDEQPQITYPISMSTTTSIPQIECLDNNNKFIFSSGRDRYETWELHCSKTEFQLKLESRSKAGMRWWGLTNRVQLEYIQESKPGQFNFVCKKPFLLPQLPTPFPVAFRHLSSSLNQNCLLYMTQDELCVILPRSAVETKLNFVAGNTVFNFDLFRFTVLDRDLLIIVLPNNIVFVILLDAFSQPRAAFELPLTNKCREQNVLLASISQLSGVDSNTGARLTIDFDYAGICEKQPHLFLPLLHYSVMAYDRASDICKHMTLEILKMYWNGSLFDEYFLVLFRNDAEKVLKPDQAEFFRSQVTTFCTPSNFSKALSEFSPFQSSYMDKHTMPPPVQNWGRLTALYPEKVYGMQNGESKSDSVLYRLLKMISEFSLEKVHESLLFTVCLQIIAVQWRIVPELAISEKFMTHVRGHLSRTIGHYWEQSDVLTVGDKTVEEGREKGDATITSENDFWRSRVTPEILHVTISSEKVNMKRCFAEVKGMSDAMTAVYHKILGPDLFGDNEFFDKYVV